MGDARAASLRPTRVSAANDLGGGRSDLVAANLDAIRVAVETDDPRWLSASEPADNVAASPRCVVAVGRYQSNWVVRKELVTSWGCHGYQSSRLLVRKRTFRKSLQLNERQTV